MTGRLLIAGLIASALFACRSAAPPTSPVASSTTAGVGTANGAAVQPSEAPAAGEVEGLLSAAQNAVAAGDEDEFHDCEAAIYQALLKTPEPTSGSEAALTYVDDVLDELARLAEQMEESDADDEEPPPEPGPVPPEKITSAQDKARTAHFDLPIVINQEVTSLIDFYTGPYRERFIGALKRGARYLPFIREQLRKAKLPLDLAYLPLVESAYNPNARSRARAQGLWQFIASTARLYGLRCNGLVDERNDPYLSTEAAVQHLSDLYSTFGSWELALAAYNSGTGRVERAVRRAHGNTDFWQIRRYLRRETRNYVPALWAVVVATKNPEAYGLPKIEDDPVCLARVPVEGALDLDVLAERGNLDSDELADLNPALTRRLTPALGSYQLAVPCGEEKQVAQVIASIPPAERVRRFLHVVHGGDTLGAVARRYGSTVDAIMAANGIRNPRRLRIGQTLVVPRGPGEQAASSHRTHRPAETAAAARETPGHYVVRRGDTLYAIARRFGCSVDTIEAANRIPNPHELHIGQVLVVPGGPGGRAGHRSGVRRPAGERTASADLPERYVVRRGDTLYGIARRFGTSAAALRRRNGLRDTTIRPGDVLYLTRASAAEASSPAGTSR
jgi:membrane-bound lytic murein transglycosylase D